MNPPGDRVFSLFDVTLLRTASLLVPSFQREDWRREWFAELWHVRRSYIGIDNTFSWNAHREITCFCLGAFPDALCLRNQPAKSASAHVHIHGSAGQTLLWLSAALALCFVISRLLPGVKAENEAAHYQIKPGVLLINEASASGGSPSISTALYQNWSNSPQRFFQDLAFYRVSREKADAEPGSKPWSIAHSSTNLFSLLGLPIRYADRRDAPDPQQDSALPSLVLSHDLWMRSFAGDPRIADRIIRIGSTSVRIAGVAPAGSWQLPGAPDAWVIESNAQIRSEAPSTAKGYLLAQLSPRGQAAMSDPAISINALNQDGVEIDLVGAPIDAPIEGAWSIFKFALFLALVALPAVISVSLGDSDITSHRPSFRQRINRILFLAAKFTLIAAIGFAASLDLAYGNEIGYSSVAECFQLLWCFTICLVGFRWAVADQRKRCPVCLRCVTNPASVGLASRTFLGWNGTEMMCIGGHALLHVPSLPTSWFSGERWLYLDSSWDFLFADTLTY
ncbi:MAG TPA: hypothetical protein VK574_16030 [Terracidiphilus sp.]|nr:hypothetical protein [Terracidiphilus sp.]